MTTATPQTMGQQFGRRSWAEPWKIKMVEPIRLKSRAERESAGEPWQLVVQIPQIVGGELARVPVPDVPLAVLANFQLRFVAAARLRLCWVLVST